MVIIILVVVPEQTNEITNLSNAQTIYEKRKYISSPDIPYVIILGDINLESLKNFVKNIFILIMVKDLGIYQIFIFEIHF